MAKKYYKNPFAFRLLYNNQNNMLFSIIENEELGIIYFEYEPQKQLSIRIISYSKLSKTQQEEIFYLAQHLLKFKQPLCNPGEFYVDEALLDQVNNAIQKMVDEDGDNIIVHKPLAVYEALIKKYGSKKSNLQPLLNESLNHLTQKLVRK